VNYGGDSPALAAAAGDDIESGYNPKARSPKGAIRLMQLMPETARRYRVIDIRDPDENLRAGARYLRDLLVMFDQNLSLALAAQSSGQLYQDRQHEYEQHHNGQRRHDHFRLHQSLLCEFSHGAVYVCAGLENMDRCA
jgi:membrane-bound lytic murein transglycosylase MltF